MFLGNDNSVQQSTMLNVCTLKKTLQSGPFTVLWTLPLHSFCSYFVLFSLYVNLYSSQEVLVFLKPVISVYFITALYVFDSIYTWETYAERFLIVRCLDTSFTIILQLFWKLYDFRTCNVSDRRHETLQCSFRSMFAIIAICIVRRH